MAGLMKSDDLGKLLLRVTTGSILLFHGYFKLMHGVEWIKGPLSTHGLPGFLAYGPYLAEIVAPLLMIVGFRTRIAAILVFIDMFMAIFLVLRQQILVVKEMGGGWAIEIEAFLLLASLAIVFMGGGRFGISKGKSTWD